MKAFPILRSDRLLLRQIRQSDIENIFKGLSNPEVTNFYGLSYDTIEETQEQMDRYAFLQKSGTGKWWAVCFAADESFIGAIGFTKLDPLNIGE
jgi:ribosomal-protein-alanine N-acetyltransferase